MNEDYTKLQVHLEDRTYPIYIGEDLLARDLIKHHISGQQVFIVTNTTVAPLYLEKLKVHFHELQCDQIILPDGEVYKTLETVSLIFDALISKKHRRNTTLIALGGGVVGDMTGFAAACYQRGVDFIQVPTTLLSQVDAAIGGKTAVNHPKGKNMIGAFHQPRAVLIDIATLRTLSDREFSCGLAEIIKAALICDEDFFGWLEDHLPQMLSKDQHALIHAIKAACAIKAKIVASDERDANIRALLNLGHTFAHALERRFSFKEWLHGEAVAMGLVLATDYSRRIGWVDDKTLDRVKNILTIAKLPIRLPNSVATKQLVECMNMDKKKDTSDLKLVLLKEIGRAVVSAQVDQAILEATITENRLQP